MICQKKFLIFWQRSWRASCWLQWALALVLLTKRRHSSIVVGTVTHNRSGTSSGVEKEIMGNAVGSLMTAAGTTMVIVATKTTGVVTTIIVIGGRTDTTMAFTIITTVTMVGIGGVAGDITVGIGRIVVYGSVVYMYARHTYLYQ